MAGEENSVLARTVSAKRPGIGRLSFDFSFGLKKLRTPAQAYDEARIGRWAAVWYVFGYSTAMVLVVLWTLNGRVQNTLIPFSFVLGFIVLGIVLSYVISSRQARAASVILLVWTIYECVKTGVSHGHLNLGTAFLVNVICAVLALRSVRGSFALASMKKRAVEAIDTFS